MNRPTPITLGVVAVFALTLSAHAASQITVGASFTANNSGLLYNSAGAGSSANLISHDANGDTPSAGGFIQIFHDISADGLGTATPGGNGVANSADNVLLGTSWVQYLPGWFDSFVINTGAGLAAVADGHTIVMRFWDTGSTDQTQENASLVMGDGSVPAIGSWYGDASVVLPVSAPGIYNITPDDSEPIVTSNQLVPEPTSIALFALGLAVVGVRSRKRKSND